MCVYVCARVSLKMNQNCWLYMGKSFLLQDFPVLQCMVYVYVYVHLYVIVCILCLDDCTV